MSHRKKEKSEEPDGIERKKSHGKIKPATRMPMQIPSGLSGPFDAAAGVQCIGEIEHMARALASGEEPDLWKLLQQLDSDRDILCKLDKSEIDAIPQNMRGHALRAFHAAQWTWIARHKKILGLLEDRGIVAFTNKEQYDRMIPQIRAIAGDVPSFPEAIIGCLQDIIKEQLLAIDFIPERFIDADFAPPGMKPGKAITEEEVDKECLPLEDYYAMTMQMLEEVFEMIIEDRYKAKVLAKGYAPYFFIWLGAENILQMVVKGLVEGDPYIRKKPLPDGGFSYMLWDPGTMPKRQ